MHYGAKVLKNQAEIATAGQKIKPAQGRLNFWLCTACNPRTDAHQDLIKMGDEIERAKNILTTP